MHCVDPFVRDSAYGESLYWRLHGRAGYRYRYSDSDLAELDAKLQAHRPLESPNYIMFNNMSSREDALRFSALHARRKHTERKGDTKDVDFTEAF